MSKMAEVDIFLLKQMLMLSISCLHSFNSGLVHAFPSILNPDILSLNTTSIKASPEEASWIAASIGLSGILGFVIISPLFQVLGRKPVILVVNAISIIGWGVLYFANSITTLLIGRVIQGLSVGGVYIIGIALGEYSDKKRRGYFMPLKKVSMAVGSLACHSLGLVMTWRGIVIIGFIGIILSVVLLLPCPESPAFLAMKGRFVESKKSYYWLFGTSSESKKEFEELICAQMKRIEHKKSEKKQIVLFKTTKNLLRKDFLQPFFIVVIGSLAMDACGRHFLLAYITQIMTEITDSLYISMYCSSLGDILLIIALSLSCIIIKVYTRRTIIFKLGSVTVILMFLIGVTSLFETKFDVPGLKWVTAGLILFNSFISHIGLVPVIFTLTVEIFPLELKGIGSFTSGTSFAALYFLTIKFTPLMIDRTGIGGTFAIYGSCVLFSLLILYFILPETKDKTLQEIENEIRGTTTSDKTDIELSLLETKLL